MSDTGRGGVAILGGGMGAMAAAWLLSEGDWKERFGRIVVYQRGWRLGGKGASGRGPFGRIEEHGLHVLLGYYDRTFALMRSCYDELDRSRNDPACPLSTWDDAVIASNDVGVFDRAGDGWVPWVASFGATRGRPGERDPAGPGVAFEDAVVRSVGLLLDFFDSLQRPAPALAGTVRLSASPPPPPSPNGAAGPASRDRLSAILRGAGLLGLALPLSSLQRLAGLVRDGGAPEQLAGAVAALAGPLRAALRAAVTSDAAVRRTHQLVELVTTNLVGIAADRLLTRPEGFAAIDHLDYRDWLRTHGIDRSALDAPLLAGMYDLVFGYEDGDPARPSFSAGLGVQLSARMLFGYSGALFWKMRAGMGDVVFAPLFEALRRRGVEFCFFHRVDALRLAPDGRSVASVELGVQAEVAAGAESYEPLVRVHGLPCWPSSPLASQLRDPQQVEGVDLESFVAPRRDARRRTLVAGRDFDTVVFGISLGMVPHVCADLLARSPAWRAMVDNVGTVATQALQLWMRADERALGWLGPAGVTVSGLPASFETWSSMPHLVAAEDWPEADRPATVAYFCSTLAEPGAVRTTAEGFLGREVAALWPDATDADGFRWDLLCDGGTVAELGPDRLDSQYWRANVDPSDRYVQSLPGTGRFRLRPGATGFDNLVVAGDWTDTGLNAGCVEAATISGELAAAAVRERAPTTSEGAPA